MIWGYHYFWKHPYGGVWQIESTFRVRYPSFSFVQAKTPKLALNCWVSGYFFSSLGYTRWNCMEYELLCYGYGTCQGKGD